MWIIKRLKELVAQGPIGPGTLEQKKIAEELVIYAPFINLGEVTG